MITQSDIVEIPITDEEYTLALKLAERNWFNGVSRIYKDRDERAKHGLRKQFIGTLGEIALYKFFFGEGGVEKYKGYSDRKHTDLAGTHRGDGGYDIENVKIDIKCSHWKNKERDPLEYHLWVMKEEFHPNWKYIFALAKFDDVQWRVYLIGEKFSEELIPTYVSIGTRYESLARDLNKIVLLEKDN